jgi:hypothetical protein
MNKIISLVGVLFLSNVEGMEIRGPAVDWTRQNEALDEEKCGVVCEALNEAREALEKELASSKKSTEKQYCYEQIAYTARGLLVMQEGICYAVRVWSARIVSCLEYASVEKRERAIQALKAMGFENCDRLPGRTLSCTLFRGAPSSLWVDDE